MNRKLLMLTLVCFAGTALIGLVGTGQNKAAEPQAAKAAKPAPEKPRPAWKVYTNWPFDAKEAKLRQQETAKLLGTPVEKKLDLGKGVTMKLVLIPAGRFRMGSPKTETRRVNERPQRQVTISKPFYMGVTEVTQAQWKAVIRSDPWHGKLSIAGYGGENAASYVNWRVVATTYCRRLSHKAGRTVRLPTEAEWEYACRAGTATKYCFGDDESKLGDYAWYDKKAEDVGERYPHRVAQKKPNAWGLYDMHGNVGEWCSDRYASSYANASTRDPKGPDSGTARVVRGGSWRSTDRYCRSAYRNLRPPGYFGRIIGFRVVLSVVGREKGQE